MDNKENLQMEQRRSAAKNRFIEWLAVPRSQRDPSTRPELAAVLKIPESTLVQWEAELGTRLGVLEATRPNLPVHYIQVVEALVEKAIKGDTKAAILCAEIAWGEGKSRQTSAQNSVNRLPYRNWRSQLQRRPVDDLADVIDGIVEKAMKGDASAARRYIYLAFDWKPEDCVDSSNPGSEWNPENTPNAEGGPPRRA